MHDYPPRCGLVKRLERERTAGESRPAPGILARARIYPQMTQMPQMFGM
jgi:hypothetical protein